MKHLSIVFMVLALASTGFAIDKAKLESRIQLLTSKLETLQRSSEKRIPPDVLRKAQGIILLDRTKGGFIFAFQGGSGLAMVKDSKNKQWSAPLFLSASEASLGFQIGGEQNFFAILLMNSNAVNRLLTDSTFEFGGEARGTAGNDTAGESGVVDPPEGSVLVYDYRSGFYGGAAIKGGAIETDTEANLSYYGQALTSSEILFERKAKPSEAAVGLAKKLTEYSETNKSQK